jgi:IS605 OrfB family transposase
MLRCMTAVKLREWRGVRPVAGPAGVAISTRLRTTPEDERVLDLVADHLGRLRRTDLARVCNPVPADPSLEDKGKYRARRDRLNARKKALTVESSARWANAIIAGKPVAYTITRTPGRAGRYLTAAWALRPETVAIHPTTRDTKVHAVGHVVAVDLNDGHLALRHLDPHGNPVGAPQRIDLDLTGSSARRDAQVRHANTRLIHFTLRHGIDTVAVEDLDFADARAVGRDTMGRGSRGKRFRKTVAGIPTAVFRNRLTAQAHRHGVRLFAVNPAYTSVWGDQHWRTPYQNVNRHEAAATVIGRRAQGYKARRRKGVTRTRPEDRVVRATDQATSDDRQVSTSNRHLPGTRGSESRPPGRARTRLLGRATVTPASGQQRPDSTVTACETT